MRPVLSALTGVALVVFLFIVTGIFMSLQEGRGFSASFFEVGQSNRDLWLRTALIAGLMLIGIVFGRLHSRLVGLPTEARVNIIEELKNAASTGGFWRSLLASPIVFGVTYWMSQNQPDPIVAGVLALENGFFCDVLFKRREAEVQGAKASESGAASR